MFAIPENWGDLSPKERMEARFESWMGLEVEFASPEVKQAYKQRVQYIINNFISNHIKEGNNE